MHTILQIVPYLAPKISGVGDYALCLAEELRLKHGISTRFLVADKDWDETKNRIKGFEVERISKRTSTEFEKLLSEWNGPILLHYVGYGYAKRGCPSWLTNGIIKWTTANCPNGRLVTMIHELFAFGPPWTSSFWLSYFQRYLVRLIFRHSTSIVVNTTFAQHWLRNTDSTISKAITLIPVFSVIGEPQKLLPWSERPDRIVVFGSGWRSGSNRDHLNAISRVCEAVQATELIWIGKPNTSLTVPGIETVFTGTITGKEISEILSESRYGYFDYWPGLLCKSSVFGAYSAHGIVPISLQQNFRHGDFLEAGIHGLTVDSLLQVTCKMSLAKISNEVQAWYSQHSIGETASIYANLLIGDPG